MLQQVCGEGTGHKMLCVKWPNITEKLLQAVKELANRNIQNRSKWETVNETQTWMDYSEHNRKNENE
jgi:hypothetical protein